jgi:hypothetical protein
MSKLRIKAGAFELDYDGTDEFIKHDLLGLISSVSNIVTKSGLAIETDTDEDKGSPKKKKSASGEKLTQLSTGSIASKLKIESGPDLIIAACAHLNFEKGEAACKRPEIVAQMKTATSYYKKSYLANLTSYLIRLVKAGKLVEGSTGEYALKAEYAQKLKEQLGID